MRQCQEGLLVRGEVHNIPGLPHVLSDLLSRLNPPELHKTLSDLLKSLGEKVSSLGVSLGVNNGGSLDLLSLFHKEFGLFRFLLGDLQGHF